MQRIALVLAVLGISLAPAGPAYGQLGGPNVPSPLTEPPPPPPVDSDLDDEGLSSLQQILIFGGAALVLAAIAFVIVRDAKRAAPTGERPRKSTAATPGAKAFATTDTSASAARARERQRAKRAKAKAKAVRRQRKRNRPH